MSKKNQKDFNNILFTSVFLSFITTIFLVSIYFLLYEYYQNHRINTNLYHYVFNIRQNQHHELNIIFYTFITITILYFIKFSSSDTIFSIGDIKKYKELPQKLGFYQNDNNNSNEKIYDKFHSYDKEKGEIIYKNNFGFIESKNYTDSKKIQNIQQFLSINTEKDYFEPYVISKNMMGIRLKSPFKDYKFSIDFLKKGQILEGFDKQGIPYYTSIFKQTHIYSTGTTGSGKSTDIRLKLISILYHLKLENETGIKYIEKLYLTDLKGGMELKKYDSMFNNKVKVNTNVEEFMNFITEFYNIMMERNKKCVENGLEFSDEPLILSIVDEFGQLSLTKFTDKVMRDKYDDTLNKLDKIMTVGRSMNMYMNFYSQISTTEHVSSSTLAMCITRCILKTDDKPSINKSISNEKLEELKCNPEYFPIGVKVLRDETESNQKGVVYKVLRGVFTSQKDVIDILTEEDKIKVVTQLRTQLEKMIITQSYIHNMKVKDRYEELIELFKNEELHKYIDKNLMLSNLVKQGVINDIQVKVNNQIESFKEIYNKCRTNNLINEVYEKVIINEVVVRDDKEFQLLLDLQNKIKEELENFEKGKVFKSKKDDIKKFIEDNKMKFDETNTELTNLILEKIEEMDEEEVVDIEDEIKIIEEELKNENKELDKDIKEKIKMFRDLISKIKDEKIRKKFYKETDKITRLFKSDTKEDIILELLKELHNEVKKYI
ncbi:FtsK/SpoIIIE domain-containing protein [Sulfurimonas sp.]|uniref:FtsK/SpoIIIE domain-containing protein n=1 Tax=Sulfurimonas sp. TaxID=2022749 RepID=UPI0025DF9D03|nr:FtsK/SpoIIIE domain-containing protein [Sulfurimonas sp.]MBW6488437.1 hypothetical protein [Sulfurimonas sp.]